MSTHGGEDIKMDKHEVTRSLENMKKPEERKEEKETEKRNRRRKSLQFLPILWLEQCSNTFFILDAWKCIDTCSPWF
jgi:hypothetical protein